MGSSRWGDHSKKEEKKEREKFVKPRHRQLGYL
jgi:hypothetical protein